MRRRRLPHETIVVGACSIALLAPLTTRAAVFEQTFEPESLTRVEIELPAADRLVLRGVSGGTRVRIDGDEHPECKPKLRQSGTVLRLRLQEEHRHRDCDLDVRIEVPARVALVVDLGAGKVNLDGLGSSLDLDLGAGDVSGDVTGEKVSVNTGAGTVALVDLRSVVEVKIGVGAIRLSFAAAPKGTVRVITGAGSIDIAMPRGTPVRLDANTGLGSVNNDLPTSPGAETEIEASTGMGAIHIGGA